MAANGILNFQGTNKATFVGASSNIVLDTVTASLGVGVDVNGPTSNLHVVGNAYVSTDVTIAGNIDFHTITQNGATFSGGGSGTSPWLQTTVGTPADGIYYTAGNVAVDTNTFFVDTTNNRVGVGTTSPHTKLNMKSGVFLAENQASTNNTVLYDDLGGSGGTDNNTYHLKDAKFGTGIFVNDTGTTGSTITLMNKEGATNITKHASIGFVNTDTTFNGKFGGQIGFWPEDANASKQQFRIYTSGASAGYNLPVQQMVVTGDGNVGIAVAIPQETLDIAGSMRVGVDGMLTISSRSSTYGSETVALQTTIDGRNLSEANPGTHGGESRHVLALQPEGGYVGIGTTSPGYTLDVTGDINIPTDGEIRKGGVVQTLGGIFSTDSTKAYYTDGPVGIANVEALTTQTLQVGANVSVNDVLSNKLSVTGSVYVTRNLHAVDLVKTYEVRCNALFIKDVRVTNQVPEDGNDVGYVPNVL